MFVLYAYECPILSAYTLQQSRDIPTVNLKVKNVEFKYGKIK